MESLNQHISHYLNQGIPFALATIITHTGSTPRTSGSKMIVLGEGRIHGTIGGGLVEARVMEACQALLPHSQGKIMEFVLNQELKGGLDMVCGGNLTVWIEIFDSHPTPGLVQVFETLTALEKEGKKAVLISRINGVSKGSFSTEKCLVQADGTVTGAPVLPRALLEAVCDNQFSGPAPILENHGLEEFIIEPCQTRDTLVIFGAGHVGFHLAKMAHLTDFRTIVVDDRAEFANRSRFEHAHRVLVADPFATAFDTLSIDKNAYIVILTRGHLHDQTVLEAALKTKAAYIGMIGSRRKRDQIYANLSKKGISSETLNQVYSPIGLEIGSETPAEIAVSIIGQIIQVRAQNQDPDLCPD